MHASSITVVLSCLFSFAIVVPAPADAAQDVPGSVEPRMTTEGWEGLLRPGGRVVMINPHGDIRARFGGYEGKVEIVASMQRLQDDQPALEIDAVEGDDGWTLTVRRKGERVDSSSVEARPAVRRGAPPQDRADVALFVPEGARLVARTEHGLLEAKGLHSDLDLTTTTGAMRIKVKDRIVNARTERGKIAVTLEPGGVTSPHRLESVQGDIEVYLAESASLRVEAATSSDITTDFSIDIRHLPQEEPGKRATATIGEGAGKLEILTRRGAIRLMRLNDDFVAPSVTKAQGQ